MAKTQEYVVGILFSRENRTEVEFVTGVSSETKIATWEPEKKPQVDIIRFDSFFRTVPYYSQIKNIFSEIRGTVLHIHSHSSSPLLLFYSILT
mgnify:CR=1 FL=1